MRARYEAATAGAGQVSGLSTSEELLGNVGGAAWGTVLGPKLEDRAELIPVQLLEAKAA